MKINGNDTDKVIMIIILFYPSFEYSDVPAYASIVNYYDNLLKQIKNSLKSKNSFRCVLREDLKNLTIENLIETRGNISLDNYIDYDLLEIKYPEYYI